MPPASRKYWHEDVNDASFICVCVCEYESPHNTAQRTGGLFSWRALSGVGLLCYHDLPLPWAPASYLKRSPPRRATDTKQKFSSCGLRTDGEQYEGYNSIPRDGPGLLITDVFGSTDRGLLKNCMLRDGDLASGLLESRPTRTPRCDLEPRTRGMVGCVEYR